MRRFEVQVITIGLDLSNEDCRVGCLNEQLGEVQISAYDIQWTSAASQEGWKKWRTENWALAFQLRKTLYRNPLIADILFELFFLPSPQDR